MESRPWTPEGGSGREIPPVGGTESHEAMPVWEGETDVEGFTTPEVFMVASVVDRRRGLDPAVLAKVTPDNLERIIDAAEARIRETRRKENPGELGTTPTAVLRTLGGRSSNSHAIQCSANKSEDMRSAREMIMAQAAAAGVPQEDKVLHYVGSVLERQAEMSDTLTALFRMDIFRRIGKAKGDAAFFSRAMGDWPRIRERVARDLAALEDADRKDIPSLPELKDAIAEVRDLLAETDADAVEDGLYATLCTGLAKAIFMEFEQIHERRLGRAAAWLESRAARRDVH